MICLVGYVRDTEKAACTSHLERLDRRDIGLDWACASRRFLARFPW